MANSQNITPRKLDLIIRDKFEIVEPQLHMIVESGIKGIPDSSTFAYKKVLVCEFTDSISNGIVTWWNKNKITPDNFNPFSFPNIILKVKDVGEKQIKDYIHSLAVEINPTLKYHFDGLKLYATWE